MRRRSQDSSSPQHAVTLPEHAVDFLASVRSERGLSRNTADAYRRDLIQYQATLEEHGGDMTADTVRAHMEGLRSAGLKTSSIARKLASIRAYHRFLVVEGLRDDDPTAAIDSPSRSSGLPKALTVEQVTAVLDAASGDDAVRRRDRAILEFLYATGCRVTELVTVDVHDIDFETRTVLLTGKGSKQRIVPVGSFAIDATERWLLDRPTFRRGDRDTGALFLSTRGNRLTRQAVWRIVRMYGIAAGVAPGDLSPHVFRHSAATHMVEGGADLRTVQELLGHASLSTTQMYTKVSPEHLMETIVTTHPRGR
jgi:integrase/recombinase XerD